MVARARGNGGEFYYLFCRGRQEGECNQPYLNVHAVEQAVLDHYATVEFSQAFKTDVRARLDEALTHDLESTSEVRERLEARLAALDTKEDNLLDLAADGDLPKGENQGKAHNHSGRAAKHPARHRAARRRTRHRATGLRACV